MTDNVADLLDRVGAFVASNRSGLIAGAIAGIVIWLILRSVNRLYERYRRAGQERMGIYLAASIQSWLFVAVFTASVWWDLGAGTADLADAQSRLWLQLPPDTTMVLWSAGLTLALGAIAFVFSEIEDALKIQPTRLSLLILPRTTNETAVWSLMVSPTAGFCEELLFRGLLMFALMDMTNDLWLSVALSSVMFGVIHAAYGPLNVFATGAMGVVLALGVVYTGSLWPSIVAHALYDMAVPFLSRMDDVPSESAEQAA